MGEEGEKKEESGIDFFDIDIISSVIMGVITDLLHILLALTLLGIPIALLLHFIMGATVFGMMLSKLKEPLPKLVLGAAVLLPLPLLGVGVILAVILGDKLARKALELGLSATGAGAAAVQAIKRAEMVAQAAQAAMDKVPGAKGGGEGEEEQPEEQAAQEEPQEEVPRQEEAPKGESAFEEMEQKPRFEEMVSAQGEEAATLPMGGGGTAEAPSQKPPKDEEKPLVRYEDVLRSGAEEIPSITKPSARPQPAIEKGAEKLDNINTKASPAKKEAVSLDVEEETLKLQDEAGMKL